MLFLNLWHAFKLICNFRLTIFFFFSELDMFVYLDLPVEVDNYHELLPLEALPSVPKHQSIPFLTSTYKATHTKTGQKFCLRRIHGIV